MTSMLLRSVFGKTLWDQRRGMVGWGIALVGLVAMMVAFWPFVEGEAANLEKIYSEEIKALFGIQDLGTPEGYLRAELLSMMLPLLLLVYAIGRGADLVAGEEERGSLDLLLAHPVPRRRIVLEKGLALGAGVLLLTALAWLATALGTLALGMGVHQGRLLAAFLLLGLFATGFGMAALALGAWRGRKGFAVGIAAALAAGAYVLNSAANLVDPLDRARWVSPFAHYLETDPLTQGLDAPSLAVLALIPAAMLGIAVWAFERRDVGV